MKSVTNEPLSDTRIRELFANSPADLTVAKDVNTLFKARLRDLYKQKGAVIIGVSAAVSVAVLIALVMGSITTVWVLLGLFLLAVIIVMWRQYSQATKAFFNSYAHARGLVHQESGSVGCDVPLLKKGDERRFEHIMAGSLCGVDGQLAHFTYTEISRDSDGNDTRTDYPFTILKLTLPNPVAKRYAGVYLGPKALSFGGLQDKLMPDRKVELESLAFAKKYSLRVLDSQDDIALYELFSTTFIEQLTEVENVYWQQQGADILFWMKKHETEAADFDAFVDKAAFVMERYRAESQ